MSASYGSLPTFDPEEAQQVDQVTMEEEKRGWRHSLGERLESQNFHMTVLALVLIDATCVAIQIIYTFFHECQVPVITSTMVHPSKESFLFIAFELAEVFSITICFLFMIEIILSLIAFGPKYFLPGWPHWKLHIFDAAGKYNNSIFFYYCCSCN